MSERDILVGGAAGLEEALLLLAAVIAARVLLALRTLEHGARRSIASSDKCSCNVANTSSAEAIWPVSKWPIMVPCSRKTSTANGFRSGRATRPVSEIVANDTGKVEILVLLRRPG